MLPRKSLVVRYVFCGAIVTTVLFLWASGPESSSHISTWRKLVEGFEMIGVNETQLRIEFETLKEQVNSSYTADNKTLEDIYRYVQELKKQLPANPHNFKYIINPKDICHGKEVFLLVYVHSAPDHYKKRTAIRETWGNPKNFPHLTYKVVFLMGRPKDKAVQDAIQLESETYNDIVQETFIDSYRNLTYKAIEGLKWISHNCNHAKFILKSDDDIFVNIFNLVAHLESIYDFRGRNIKGFLLCLVWYRMKVIRDPKSKWYIPKSEFSEDFFPTYCSGSAYVMSSDVVTGMYNASMDTPFFWVDDFYITGLLASKVKVVHEKFNSVYTLGPSTFLEKFTEPNKWRTLVFGHVHNLNHMHQVWKNILVDRKIIIEGSNVNSSNNVTVKQKPS